MENPVEQARKAEEFSAVQIPSARLAELKPNILIVDDRKENLLATEKVLQPLRCVHIQGIIGQ